MRIQRFDLPKKNEFLDSNNNDDIIKVSNSSNSNVFINHTIYLVSNTDIEQEIKQCRQELERAIQTGDTITASKAAQKLASLQQKQK
jgi:hypothetical protein